MKSKADKVLIWTMAVLFVLALTAAPLVEGIKNLIQLINR